jgi:hypothetical protein
MNSWSERLVWMLAHSLWQIALAWILLKLALTGLRKRSAQARYVVCCAALSVATLAPWATFFSLDLGQRLQSAKTGARVDGGGPVHSATEERPAIRGSPRGVMEGRVASVEALRERLSEGLIPFFPWIAAAWLLGTSFCWIRLILGWRATRRLARAPLGPLPAHAAELFRNLCQKLGVDRAIRIGISVLVEIPTVVGWLKPVILVPASSLTGLSESQLEAILAHELAHIIRCDFLVNMLQAIAEAVFFYHPAVRAINRQIRFERELACDEIAIGLSGDPLRYAQALAAIESARAPDLALAATGEGELLARIRRLLGVEAQDTWKCVAWTAVAGVVLYLAGMFVLPPVTAWMMTAKQRIEAVNASMPPTQFEIAQTFGSEGTMLVEGEVRNPNGSRSKGEFSLRGYVESYRIRRSIEIPVKNGRFLCTVDAGVFSIGTWLDGYAPLTAGPFFPDLRTRAMAPIKLTLALGREARVRFVDRDGRPVAGVGLTASAVGPASWAGDRVLGGVQMHVSDAAGEATIEDVGSRTVLMLTIKKSGYRSEHREVREFPAGGPLVWVLGSSEQNQYQAQVVDDKTGQPVTGVRVLRGTSVSPIYGSQQTPLAVTDSNGRFSLQEPDSGFEGWIYLESDDYPRRRLRLSGGLPPEIRLARGFELSGRIVGLPDGDAPIVCRLIFGPIASGTAADLPFQSFPPQEGILHGSGGERSFSFSHLPSCEAVLAVAGRRFPVELRGDLRDKVFDVSAKTAAATPSKRTVRVRFELEPGEPPPTGSFRILYSRGVESEHPFTDSVELVPVEGDHAEFSLPAPTKLAVEPEKLIGYWFADVAREIPSGGGPFVVDIPLVPAGAIQGRLLESDGRPAGRMAIACIEWGPNDTAGSGRRMMKPRLEDTMRTDGRFTATPVPLGSRYIIVAHDGCNFTVSRPIRVDSLHPFPDMEIRRAEGTTIAGRVVNREGKPVPNLSFSAYYDTGPPAFVRFRFPGMVTDGEGNFSLEHINLDLPGSYEFRPDGIRNSENAHFKLDRRTNLPFVISFAESP